MAKKGDIIAGLDIGTTKICTIIGQVGDNGRILILGIGVHPSKGLRKGVVVNIESTVQSIKSAVEEAETIAGVELDSVYVGIAGGHIKGFNSHGTVALKHHEVTPNDIGRVIDAAKAVAIPMDREVIHVLPQEFIVDDQEGVKEPLGMFGVRLEAKVHIITAAVTSAQNIMRAVNKAGLEVKDIVLEQLASSYAVLTPDERELGAAIIDIGGGTADLAILINDAVKHTSVLSLGGNSITNDLAIGLRTPTNEAERIKKIYGCALTSLVNNSESIEVPSVGGRDSRILSRKVLSEIIEPRVEEMFTLLHNDIIKSGYLEKLASGIVLTGGATMMDGMVELAEQIFQVPVRKGYPIGLSGLTEEISKPIFSTGVGLVLFGSQSGSQGRFLGGPEENLFNKIFKRMKDWFGGFF